MRVLNPPSPAFCAQVLEAEDKIIPALGTLAAVDPRLAKACTSLRGWAIDVAPTDKWWSGTQWVSGQTFCPHLYFMINNALPLEGSLSHEMVHAAQNCEPLPPIDEDDYYHSNWEPIYPVLDGIQ